MRVISCTEYGLLHLSLRHMHGGALLIHYWHITHLGKNNTDNNGRLVIITTPINADISIAKLSLGC